MTRWKAEPLKERSAPVAWLCPFSPVHKALKFSAVFGTVSAKSSIEILPAFSSPMVTSMKTLGLGPPCATTPSLSSYMESLFKKLAGTKAERRGGIR